MNERRLIMLFFIYLVLEGALRKWALPSYSAQLFLVKHVLLACALFVYFSRNKLFYRAGSRTISPLRSEMLMFSGWVFFACGSVFVTGFSMTFLIGLSYYLVMLPLVVIIPQILRDVDDLENLLLKYALIAIPICLLGIMQFNSAPDAFINRYAWSSQDMAVAVFGENKARITGTFSYISPFVVYLQFMFLVSLALIVLTENEKTRIILSLVCFVVFINIVLTGSRGPFLVSIVCAVPFARLLMRLLKKRGGGFSIVLTVALLSGLIYLSGDVINLLSERNKQAQDADARISGMINTPLETLKKIDIVGSGIGTTFMGVREGGAVEEVSFDEVTVDRIGLELGFFGYLFFIAFKLVFLYNTWDLYRNASNHRIKVLTLVVLMNQVSYALSIPIYSTVASALFFGSIGMYIFLRHEQSRLDYLSRTSPAAV